jgi:hypothetical protein
MRPLQIVPIEDILIPRGNIEERLVDKIARAIEQGERPSPVKLAYTPNGYRVVHGRHLILAQERAGYREVRAEVL